MRHRALAIVTAVIGAVSLIGGTLFIVRQTYFGPTTINALFATATAIYPGDEVRIAGVKVGTISSMQPEGTHARLTMTIDHGVEIPADAQAIIVAQNLVSARFVQLTPLYRSGPQMADGATIPIDRTGVPVEWDEVKRQLTRLATDLGPGSDMSSSSAGRFINSAADALDGNGAKLRETIAQLSAVAGVIASGSGNVVSIIRNLQVLISALRGSSEQIVQFEDRLATLTSVLNGGRSDINAALTNLSEAIGEVKRFVAETGDKTSEQVQRLADVTQNLVDHRMDLEQVLHVAPTALANSYNMFDPRTGGPSGVFVVNDFSSPVQFLCGEIAAQENVTAAETGKLCAQYLGPALQQLNFNNLPFALNPFVTSVPSADQLIYSEPQLAPGGGGGSAPPPLVPSVSAYTGADHPAPKSWTDLMLPAEGSPPP